jgi:hypothetical protein
VSLLGWRACQTGTKVNLSRLNRPMCSSVRVGDGLGDLEAECLPRILGLTAHSRRGSIRTHQIELVFVNFGVSKINKYLFLWSLSRAFDTVPALDHIGLEAYRSRSAVEFEEQAARVAEHRADFISSPQRGCRCRTVLAYRL